MGLYAVEIIEQNFSADGEGRLPGRTSSTTPRAARRPPRPSLSSRWTRCSAGASSRTGTRTTSRPIPLAASQIPRVGYIPIAVASYTKNQAAAQQFIDFLMSEEGQAIFAKYGYFTTPEQAFAYMGEEKPVGGEYTLPADWVTE